MYKRKDDTYFIWLDGNMVYEFTGTDSNTYTYGHRLLFSEEYKYILNAHGDVEVLIESDNTFVHRYRYDAFGNELTPSESDTNPFRYCAEYFDSKHSQEITFVGHSKGGGEAIAAATATGHNAITFNAANFDFNNYLLFENSKSEITNYYLENEILSSVIGMSRIGNNIVISTDKDIIQFNAFGINIIIPDSFKRHSIESMKTALKN